MTITKIITHAGQFHADEILSIALLRVLGFDAPVERTFTPTEQDLADPQVFVLDVGKRYEPHLGNFDHHQDGSLNATNILVLYHFEEDIPGGLRVAAELAKRLFRRVSNIDCGRVAPDSNELPEFNTLIRAFNSLPNGFNRAVYVATEILDAMLETSRKAVSDEDRWYALEKQGGVAIQHDTNAILCWKEKAKKEGIYMLVCPNVRGGYSVISRDAAELVIPEDSRQTFRHASGFMATYPDYETALDVAFSVGFLA